MNGVDFDNANGIGLKHSLKGDLKRKSVAEKIYAALRKKFGFQNWWPAKTKFEIVVGAILTQQTKWESVEKAIKNLRKKGMLNPKALIRSSANDISTAIKNVNFYKTKTERLKEISRKMVEIHRLLKSSRFESPEEKMKWLKNELKSVKGVGDETAESIMLYYFELPEFVVDAYSLTIFKRLFKKEFTRKELKEFITKSIKRDVELYKDYHAQLVELGKKYCSRKPKCAECPLKSICATYKSKEKQKRKKQEIDKKI